MNNITNFSNEFYKIYTDGSKCEGSVGIAVWDETCQLGFGHKLNKVMSSQQCWLCIKGGACDICKDRTRVFTEEPVNQFMAYVMEVRKAYKNVCVIAHNGQSFDFQFLLKYVLEETQFTPELITRGTKIILMEIDNVKFIDFLNYMPMPLSKLPKAFDLPEEKKKDTSPTCSTRLPIKIT